MTESIGINDVLLGRGGATNNNEGNRRFRAIVADHQKEYLGARKKDKVIIARRIVATVLQNGGRFLKRDRNSDAWIEVPNKRATEKTSQALREGLDVRHQTVRPSKLAHRGSDSTGGYRRTNVVSGKVTTPNSPTLVSLPGDHEHSIPDMSCEPLEETVLRYQPSPISENDVDQTCEI